MVDERDRPVRGEPRAAVHEQNLLHRAVHVLAFNRQGDLFLQRRGAAKESWPGFWDSSASGHVREGETYADAARRELFEELGVEAIPDFIGKLDACPETENEFTAVYALIFEGPFAPNPDEIDEARFFPIHQIHIETRKKAGRYTPSFMKVFRFWASAEQTIGSEG